MDVVLRRLLPVNNALIQTVCVCSLLIAYCPEYLMMHFKVSKGINVCNRDSRVIMCYTF